MYKLISFEINNTNTFINAQLILHRITHTTVLHWEDFENSS